MDELKKRIELLGQKIAELKKHPIAGAAFAPMGDALYSVVTEQANVIKEQRDHIELQAAVLRKMKLID